MNGVRWLQKKPPKERGNELEVALSPDGEIIVVEKEIPTKDLPKVVAAAVEAKYPKAEIKKVEELSKNDSISGYEVELVTADKKKLEATFDAKGKFVEEEKPEAGGEKKEEKKDKK